MPNKLIIVESPTKANTITKFLGKEYEVDSSFGHVRDLPKSELGVDVENDFEPKYVIPTKARKQVNKLRKEAEKAEEIILATDEDREGEAIAFHLVEALKLKDKLQEGKIKRIAFHEITKEAIEKALKNPREIDMNLVDAQQSRRVLDRLVGYKLSPLLWKKVARGLSAGRVQSVALRLIAEREAEIKAFKPEEYFTITAEIEAQTEKEEKAKAVFLLSKINKKNIEPPGIINKEEAEEAEKSLKEKTDCQITKVLAREVKKTPLPPFITSTLQQEAVKRLGFSSKKTMMLAQRLYEKGLITYMRTDSVNIAKEALAAVKKILEDKYGSAYAVEAPRKFSGKSKLAQEAHEAIRPTKPEVTSEDIEVEKDVKRLYDLIWRRFVASQMPKAVFKTITAEAEAGEKKKYTLKTSGSTLVFDGFLKVWPSKFKENEVPPFKENTEGKILSAALENHFTQPPARFNEASLIKTMEENGIGRPSTYASIISVIQARNYVIKNEQRRFEPTEIGGVVNNLLTEHFPKIVDIGFTADVEEELDEVALGVSKWREVISKFYGPFAKRLEEKYLELDKKEIMPEEKTNEKCEKCGKPMIIKIGRFGKFLACSGFPECKNTKTLEGGIGGFKKFESQKTGIICPKCKEGELVSKRVSKGRARGKIFWGCSRYPECDHAVWEKPGEEKKEKTG